MTKLCIGVAWLIMTATGAFARDKHWRRRIRYARAGGGEIAPMRILWPLLAAATLGAGAAHAGDKSCQLQTVGEMDVKVDGAAITTEAAVNGQSVRLTVDTGSDTTLLYRDAAKRLGLHFRHLTGAEDYAVGGVTKIYSARVKEFRVGAMVERDADLVATGQSDGRSDGALGVRFLTQHDVEFDLAHGKIRFFKPVGCDGDQVVYWGAAYSVAPLEPTPDYSLLVKVRVNGAFLTAQIDTGSEVSTVTPNAAARAGLSKSSAGVTRNGEIAGSGRERIKAYVGTFDSFGFGQETIRNAKLWIADLFHYDKEEGSADLIPKTPVGEPDMLLGADFFRSHRVYVSVQQHKVYVSYAGGPVFETNGQAPASRGTVDAPVAGSPADAPLGNP
jgi:predicted aspartyl protease